MVYSRFSPQTEQIYLVQGRFEAGTKGGGGPPSRKYSTPCGPANEVNDKA